MTVTHIDMETSRGKEKRLEKYLSAKEYLLGNDADQNLNPIPTKQTRTPVTLHNSSSERSDALL